MIVRYIHVHNNEFSCTSSFYVNVLRKKIIALYAAALYQSYAWMKVKSETVSTIDFGGLMNGTIINIKIEWFCILLPPCLLKGDNGGAYMAEPTLD